MTTLTIHPVSEEQETAVRIFLDALHIEYNASSSTDDTAYLLSSKANKEHLERSIAEAKKGDLIKLGLDDIWKP